MASISRVIISLAAAACLAPAADALAHCDTLSGAVVAAARTSLATGDVTPSLIWVRESEEAELRQAFDRALTVRRLGQQAQDLADRFFFETLVRLHRLGEGEPYTGLKDAEEVDPGVEAADKALQAGDLDPLQRLISDEAASGLRARFAAVRRHEATKTDSVEAGREYVAAYVAFVHYVEELHAAAAAAEVRHD